MSRAEKRALSQAEQRFGDESNRDPSQAEHEEADTPSHVLLRCPALMRQRFLRYGTIIPSPQDGSTTIERWRPWRPKCGPSRAVRLRRAGGRCRVSGPCRAQRPEGHYNNNNNNQAEPGLEPMADRSSLSGCDQFWWRKLYFIWFPS